MSDVIRRGFDLTVSLLAGVLSAPVVALLAVAIRLESPGHPLYTQTRVGQDGREFAIFKLRTMVPGAEFIGAGLAIQEGDDRITATGRFLRRYSLDELPNLWNVLRGEMSIVGPRPERPEFLEQLQDTVPFWTRRHLVKPGITGWAQVRRGYTADAEGTADKLSYDLWYLRHRSLVIDLAVCVKTFTTIVTGSGAR
jgi:lipopolysaccharide/colanic/teichoic acid biosynthesis glycosyltransferase